MKSESPATILATCLACVFAAMTARGADLTVITTAEGSEDPLPARIHLLDADGKVVPAEGGLPVWNDHLTSPGTANFSVRPGKYPVTVEHGPEWSAETNLVEITAGLNKSFLSVPLKRIANLAGEGWWSGEMHIHRPLDQAELLMRAEDLHFGQFISWWNRNNPWTNTPLPTPITRQFDANSFAQQLGGEDERDGGALLFFNLDKPIDITAGRQHFPSSLEYAQPIKEAGGWIDIEKPFWWDVPMWVAHGIGDSIGIANNHMYRSGVLGNEAWGHARDLEKYPGPRGNGSWTQDIYYHLLNCGVRLPPSAGSASGVLPNPVGYNRVYVQMEGEPTPEKWFEGLKAGRVFVSNGPLLRVKAGGQFPGHVFQPGQDTLDLVIDGKLDSRDPIERIELVRNGHAEEISLPARITIQESGWFLVRAITTLTNTLRFASTGPFYVELAGQPIAPQQGESADFFVKWCEERITTLTANPELTAQQKESVLQPWREALAFWQEKKDASTPRQTVRGEVIDADTGRPLAARVYLKDDSGSWHFVSTTSTNGSAVRYEKRNWVNTRAEEFHTTISAHPFEAKIPPGRYELIVERGKEYFPATNTFSIGEEPVSLQVPLKRWINLAERGWFSGDTHVHRTLGELPNLVQAENLNVAFPLSYWVTHAFRPPTAGDKSLQGTIPDALITVDPTHVIWPRNTEWEIFSVNGRSHTLGAVFALGHQEPFELGVPTVKNVAARARQQGALLDLDKHDWPWSMTLPPNMGVQLYELANNHMWRTEFGFTNWNSPTPEWLRPPLNEQTGNEREWIQFTMANYYALLNCGLNLVPTAGTANGVHPVPLGFGRVYVNLPVGFSYEGWKRALQLGRSFVTTGPMLFATVNGRNPGEVFATNGTFNATVSGEIISEQPLSFAEVIHDGRPVITIMGRNERTESGAFKTAFTSKLSLTNSGWLAVRCWEDRPLGRVRHAHTAPWHVKIEGKPLLPRLEERDYLAGRVRAQIERSKEVLPPEAIAEYAEALAYYEKLPTRTELDTTARGNAYNPDDWIGTPGRVRVIPYPGGRHPRMGFFDGALDPQRETKVTIFTPWDPASYIVVDVPEAIFSNLGLTYLAHQHIDTIWDQQGVQLPPLEWKWAADGSLTHERTLPNGIAFGARVTMGERHVEMELWLKNGTPEKLTNLRVQNCVMLKGASGFNAQSNWNKHLEAPFAAAHSDDGRRWIITAWEHCNRVWANPPVPCFHSDPQFPDLEPGATGRLKGWVWFHEGTDLDQKLAALKAESHLR